MLENGYVKLHRKITKWGWYKNANTARLFIHLLLTANYESHIFENITIQRGQRIINREKLAEELGLSVQKIRTALEHLKSTGEITVSTFRKFSIATLNNYDLYQQSDNGSTNDQPVTNRLPTDNQPVDNHNERKKKKDKESKNAEEGSRRFGEYRHVVLSDEQYGRLLSEFGEAVLTKYIRKIDEWIQLKGSQPYNDFELALKGWIERDGASAKNGDDDGVEKYKFVINRFDL